MGVNDAPISTVNSEKEIFMSPKARQITFSILMLVGWFIIIIPLAMIHPALAVGVPLLFIALFYGYSYIKSPTKHEILSTLTPIPENLQSYHDEVVSMGFKPMGEGRLGVFGIKLPVRVYNNEAQTTFAALIRDVVQPRLGFTTYLEDGTCISTHYPVGNPLQTKKLIRNVVATSISAAFDYHEQHFNQHIPEHGNPKTFDSMESVLEWERKQRYDREQISGSLKMFWRIAIAFVLIVALLIVVYVPIIIYMQKNQVDISTKENIASSIGLVFVISFILATIWIFRPFFDSVEDRKKRKPKDEA